MNFLLRDARESDAAAIAEIYGHYVRTSSCTFEEIAPDAAEMAARLRNIVEAGLPYCVAEEKGNVTGYAYAGPFRTRSAYRFTVENSVYVAAGCARGGIGTALMERLIKDCAGRGFRQMIAGIGDSENAASIALHRKLGFGPAGELKSVGFKFGRWVDVVWMQRALGPETP